MSRQWSWRRECAIGLGTYAVYLGARSIVYNDQGRQKAEHNAARLISLERRLRIHVEPALQEALLPRRWLIGAMNASYMTLNIGLTVGCLGLLYRKRHPAYHALRSAAVGATIAALPVFVRLPTAPPRKQGHFIDTIAGSGLDLDSGLVAKLYCPIAAMPSIHMAYAVVTAAALRALANGGPAKGLASAYPPGVALIVMSTANHFVLDVVAGAGLGWAAVKAATAPRQRRAGLGFPGR